MRIYSILSDKQEDEEFSKNLKLNSIGQKFLYFAEGATSYYAYKEKSKYKSASFTSQEYVSCIAPHIKDKQEITIIALGCGDLSGEIEIMKELIAQGKNVTLVGVDSSLEMLQIAAKRVAANGLQANLRRADITTTDFKNDIEELTKNDQQRIFTFFGATIANVDQKMIVSILYNLLAPGDLLWLDVRIREGITPLDDAKVFQELTLLAKDTARTDFWIFPLKKHGISFEDGSITLDVVKESYIGSLKCVFSFALNKPVEITLSDEVIPFQKDEQILLLIFRRYDPKALISYLEQYNFKSIEYFAKEKVYGQFLFLKQ